MNFQSEKSFGKLRLRAFQPYQILCMLKHVEDVCVCSFPIFDIFDIHSITALRCIWSIFDIFDIFDIHSITSLRCIWSIFHTFDIALISCINLSQHLQHQTISIYTRPLMYTQQIRWQWVWMSGFLAILFEVGLILIQRVKSNRVLIRSFKPK